MTPGTKCGSKCGKVGGNDMMSSPPTASGGPPILSQSEPGAGGFTLIQGLLPSSHKVFTYCNAGCGWSVAALAQAQCLIGPNHPKASYVSFKARPNLLKLIYPSAASMLLLMLLLLRWVALRTPSGKYAQCFEPCCVLWCQSIPIENAVWAGPGNGPVPLLAVIYQNQCKHPQASVHPHLIPLRNHLIVVYSKERECSLQLAEC